MSERTFTIRELASEFSISLRTIRFYEDRGLVSPQRDGLVRTYSEVDREHLRIALFCRRIGMSVAEAGRVIDLYDRAPSDGSSVAQLISLYTEQIEELEVSIADKEAAISAVRSEVERLRTDPG